MASASAPAPSLNVKSLTWSPALICLVGATCASIICFTSYRIIRRNHGGSFSRNRVGGQLLDEGDPDNSSLQLPSQGLDSSTVNLLPIAQFKKSEGKSHSNTDCAVCLGEFEEGELLKHLPNCSHAFHIPCIDTWFESHSNCPLCRSHVYGLTMDHEFSGSMYTLLDTLSREDFFQERAGHYQILRAEILRTSTYRQHTENGD